MNQMDLSLEELPEMEAPMTDLEGVAMCVGMFGLGVVIGVGVAIAVT